MRTGRFQAPISIVARLALALLIFTATTSSLLAQAKRDVASEQQRIDALTREITIALAAASNAVDRSARKVSLLQALASLDALALESAETAGAFDVQALLQETASAVLADPSDASFEGARDDLTILRTIVNRIGDPVVRLPNLIEIAKLELRNGQTTSSKGTLLKSSDLVTRMDPGDVQDRFLAGLIRAAMPIESLELMILAEWIPRVGDATLRSTAARAFALYLLSHNRVNNEVRQSIGIRDIARRDQRLAELAQGYASTRRFRNALLSALTIEGAGFRDRTLEGIFRHQIKLRNSPDALLTHQFIEDAKVRDNAHLTYVYYTISRRRLSNANLAASRIAEPFSRVKAFNAIAQWNLDQGYLLVWESAWDSAALAVPKIADQALRARAAGVLAAAAAKAADAGRAYRFYLEIESSRRQQVDAEFALLDAAAGRVEDARKRLASIHDPWLHSYVAAHLVRALYFKNDYQAAEDLAGGVKGPLPRVVLLVAQAEALFGRPQSVHLDISAARQRLHEAADALAALPASAKRTGTVVAVAKSLAKFALPDAFAALGAIDLPANAQADVDAYRASAFVRAGRAEEALRMLDSADSQSRDRLTSEIAIAIAEQDPIRATRLSLAIGKLTAQTRTLRRIAELQSQQQAEATEQGSEKLGPNVNRAPIVAAPTVAGTSGTFIMLSANQREFGRRFPDYPDASEISAATIKATVPPTAPGHAYVVPVGFSNFNEKFSYLRYLNNLDFAGGDTGILAVGQHTRFPRFVLIESGVFDMPSLVRLLQSSDVGSVIEKVGRHYQINVPLLIGQNATLVVSEADVDELRLNTAAAAYLINSGRFYLVGAKLTSWDPGTATPSPRSAEQWADFNSFYVGWSGSETYIAEAQVSSLGYASGKSYGFTLSSGPTRVLSATWNTTPRPKGIIVDSVFDQMYYGFYSYEASDVWIVGNHFKNNHIYAIDPHDRSNNLVIQNNAASSTKEKHGIILSRDVTHSTIVGNITFDSGGSGIMLDRSSDENVVAYNLSFGNNNDGLTVFESSCNLVSSNTMYGNGRDGVRIRNSWDILLSANGIESNGSAGIFAYTAGLGGENGTGRDLETDPYYVYSDLIAVRNRLKGNAVAMGAAGVSAVQVGGNDFAVAPDERLLSSDLAEAGFGFLSASAEGAVLRDVCRPLRPAESCSLREDGYFGSDIVAEIQAASTPQSLLAGRGCEPRSAVPVRIEATSQ